MSHDGFRIHKNPDKSYVFVEGRKPRNFLTRKESQAMERCFRKRKVNLDRDFLMNPHYVPVA